MTETLQALEAKFDDLNSPPLAPGEVVETPKTPEEVTAGMAADVLKALAGMAAIVFPSLKETMPPTVCEAMAQIGAPVLVKYNVLQGDAMPVELVAIIGIGSLAVPITIGIRSDLAVMKIKKDQAPGPAKKAVEVGQPLIAKPVE